MYFWNKRTTEQEQDLLKQVQDLQRDMLAKDERVEVMATTIHNHAQAKQELDAKLLKAQKETAELTKQHKLELAAIETSISKRVNSALASIGVQRFANETFSVDSKPSDQEALNKFNSLTGVEKTEYYNSNKAQISRALLPK